MALKPVFTASGQTILTNEIGQVLMIGADGRVKFDWRKFEAPVFLAGPGQSLVVGDGAHYWLIGPALDGAELTDVVGYVVTASSSGNITVQVHDLAKNVDLLSTILTVEPGENSSKTATTAPVINTLYKTLYMGQVLRFDVDSIGTGTTGLQITLSGRMGASTSSPDIVTLGDTVDGTATVGAGVTEGFKAGDAEAQAMGASLSEGIKMGDTFGAGLSVSETEGVKMGDSSKVDITTGVTEGLKPGDSVFGEKV